MSNKFKAGDKVTTRRNGGSYTVVKTLGVQITVRGIFGTELNYNESDLMFLYDDIPITKDISNLGDKCPKCQTPWTVTNFGLKKWYDCANCKKKAEDLLNYSTTSTFRSSDDDLLKQLEMMLHSDDDDDDDDGWMDFF